MELRHFRYFVAVAEELSFTRAARRLHTSEPSLGQQIRNLEAEIGTQLLIRDRHHVELTAAGGVLLNGARDVLTRAHQSVQLAVRASKHDSLLTLGVVLAAEIKIVPSLLTAIKQRSLDLSLVIRHISSAEQIRELRNCTIDGGLLAGPVVDSELEWMELLTDQIVVVLPRNHPAAKCKKVSLDKLRAMGLACIGATGALTPNLARALAPFFESEKRHITFSLDAPNVLGELNMVKTGHGFAVLPDYVRFMLPTGVVARALDWDPPLSVSLGFAWRRSNQSNALRLFRRILVESSRNFSGGKGHSLAQ